MNQKDTVAIDESDQQGAGEPSWRAVVARYQQPQWSRGLRQIANTFLPYLAIWVLLCVTLGVSLPLTIGLIILAAGFLIRLFIIFHDCGHGSFLPSRRANDLVGYLTGILTFTPYFYWRHTHAIHHATSGNLDRRGVGDIWTMTVAEYRAASPYTRFRFRAVRNPFVLFTVGPAHMSLVANRFAGPWAGWRWHRSVLLANLGLVGLVLFAGLLVGFKTYLLVQIPILFLAWVAGMWLFYVQHQFEGVVWKRSPQWDYVTTSLRGSSYYRLPRVLQWFSGNIGFHHIHHLGPRIPNYHLERCHRENAMFQNVTTLRLRNSLRSLRLRLWDEERGRLVGFEGV
jgi:omega-6 fatty acid desaturase (delta-12 desaturase)